MITLKVEISKESLDVIKRLPEKALLGMQKGMRKAVMYTEAESKKNFGKQGHLKARTGHLRRSITSGVRGLEGFVKSDVVYAGIHQYGGIIKAKEGKYLRFQVNGNWKSVKEVVMPARPFIIPDQNRISQFIEDAIIQETK